MQLTRQHFLQCVVATGLAAACGDGGESTLGTTGGAGDSTGGNGTTTNTGGNTTTTSTAGNGGTGGTGGSGGSGGMNTGAGGQMMGCGTMHLNGVNGGALSQHGHQFTVTEADVAAMQDKTYLIQGTSAHPHTITVTAAQFAQIDGGATIQVQSSTDSTHYHVYSITCT